MKDRNGMDLTEAEDIKKKWQEYTELHRKDLHNTARHPGMQFKWALGSITTNKASGGDEIPVELFQILKDDAVKVLHSICQQIGKPFQSQRKAMPKNAQTAAQLHSSHTLVK